MKSKKTILNNKYILDLACKGIDIDFTGIYLELLFLRIAEVLTECRQSRCVEDAKCESEAVHI